MHMHETIVVIYNYEEMTRINIHNFPDRLAMNDLEFFLENNVLKINVHT